MEFSQAICLTKTSLFPDKNQIFVVKGWKRKNSGHQEWRYPKVQFLRFCFTNDVKIIAEHPAVVKVTAAAIACQQQQLLSKARKRSARDAPCPIISWAMSSTERYKQISLNGDILTIPQWFITSFLFWPAKTFMSHNEQ